MPAEHYTHALAREMRGQARDTAASAAAAMALPDDAHDMRTVSRGEYVAWWRRQSFEDVGSPAGVGPDGMPTPAAPGFVEREYDRLAPQAVTLPDGKTLRAQAGLEHFHALVKEARPDLYLAGLVARDQGGV